MENWRLFTDGNGIKFVHICGYELWLNEVDEETEDDVDKIINHLC